jgi:uncharacterized protein
MRPSEALALHRDEALAILARYPVSNPRVFGSVARGEDTEQSDIDIIVDPAGGEIMSYFDLAMFELELSEALGCKVDVGLFKNLKKDVVAQVMRDMRPL